MIDAFKAIYSKYKRTFIGFLSGLLVMFFSVIIVADDFLEKGIDDFWVRCYVYLGMVFVWFIIWFKLKGYFPKSAKGKIGIIISITTENDKQKLRIRNDFVSGMIENARKNNLINLINILCLEDDYSVRANEIIDRCVCIKNDLIKKGNRGGVPDLKESNRVEKLLNKLNGQLIIYGSIKERLDEGNRYFFKLDACVRHKPINIGLSKEIAKEFQAILPKEISFYEKLEFRGFEFASDVVFIAARYMIGVAAFLSCDPFIAYQIHNGLLLELKKFNPQPPNLKHISKKLVTLLTEELLQQSKYFYMVKKDTKTANDLLMRAELIDDSNYHVYIFRSFYTFQIQRDAIKAIEYCKAAKSHSNGNMTWLYNQAFLNMYLGNYEEGYRNYKHLKNTTFRDEIITLNECIGFNENYVETQPSFSQSYFVLGYLYYFKKNQPKKALVNFNKFIELTKGISELGFLHAKAISFIEMIKNKKGEKVDDEK